VIRGILVGESLRPGTRLDLGAVRGAVVARNDLGSNAGPGQPSRWTLIEFEAEDDEADRLASALAEILEPEGGWYCDFTVGGDHVVVYAGTIFRYRKGDAAGRARAVEHGRRVGVPEAQLDWGE
jgi:hypothetical protein